MIPNPDQPGPQRPGPPPPDPQQPGPDGPPTLAADRPATTLDDAWSLDNRRVAVTVFGGTGTDRLPIGRPGRPPLLELRLVGPAGTDDGPVTAYGRQLRLDQGVATHVWRTAAGDTSQEAFVSDPADVVVVHRRWEGSTTPDQRSPGRPAPGRGSVRVEVGTGLGVADVEQEVLASLGVALWSATLTGADRLPVAVGVHSDGAPTMADGAVTVTGASWLTVALAVADVRGGPSPEVAARVGAALAQGAAALRLEHLAARSRDPG